MGLPCNAGDPGQIPRSGRSPGGGCGNTLQSCLENPTDRGAWQATVHGVAKSWTWLSTHAHTRSTSVSFEITRNGNRVVIAAASILFHQLKSLQFEGELTILHRKQKGFSGDKNCRIQLKLWSLNIYKIYNSIQCEMNAAIYTWNTRTKIFNY